MSSPKLRVIFRPNAEIQTFFRPKSGGLQKKKKKRCSPKLRVIFRPKSGIQAFFSPKIRWSSKKKKSSPKLEVIFRPGSLGFGWWGGDASLTGAELFEIEAAFSAKIVTFRLVVTLRNKYRYFTKSLLYEIEADFSAKMHPPPKSATVRNNL